MTNEELEVCLGKFPNKMQIALKNSKHLNRFLSRTKLVYDEVVVYRAVLNDDKVDRNDFLSKYEIEGKDIDINNLPNHITIDWFSISVNESLDSIRKMNVFANQHYKGIAQGEMKSVNGVADFIENKTHHNWYLFENRLLDVIDSFSIIEKL